LDFDITAGAYNSSINIAQMSDATFTPSTVTVDDFDATATQFQSGDWSTKNTTIHFSYDVKARVEANNVLAFAIYTNTGREQTLKDVKLVLNYSDVPVAKYSYSLKAVTAGAVDIKTLASGEEFETNDVTLYFPYMFYNESTLYTTATTPYSVTVDKDDANKTVTYATANSNIVAYMEGESATANSGFNAAYSNGKNGYAAGNNTVTITTLPAGKYTATIYLVGNPNRACVIRDKDNSDVETNVIISLPITKTSPAGTYTSDEFTLTEETTIGFSGYTSGTKTNQSADIDYIYIQKTGEVATIGSTGWATFSSDYALDFTGISEFEAYMITGHDGNVVTKSQVTGTVPAGTGLLLKGGEGNYNIPIVGSSLTDVSANLMKAGTGASVSYEAGKTKYVLGVSGSDEAEFQKIVDGGSAATVAKGKAYLQFNEEILARSMRFSGDITGVENVEAAAEAKAKEGKFIENGKLVIVKNGVKFNAAGAKLY
jgi:hypothetical protein